MDAISLRRRMRAVRRRITPTARVWERGLPGELSFWRGYIETGGLNAPDELRGRLDPRSPILDPFLLDAIDRVPAGPVRMIDVGAGPLTSVGYTDPRAPERVIELTAVDPLAEEYRVLLAAAGISPPVTTQHCRGEDVAERFGCARFDIAYARNSLDHAADPMAAITSMVRATKPGGAVVLIHGRREGEARGYEELHQWNFDLQAERLVLFGRRRFHDVGECLGDAVQIITDTFDAGEHGRWVAATLAVSPARSDTQ